MLWTTVERPLYVSDGCLLISSLFEKLRAAILYLSHTQNIIKGKRKRFPSCNFVKFLLFIPHLRIETISLSTNSLFFYFFYHLNLFRTFLDFQCLTVLDFLNIFLCRVNKISIFQIHIMCAYV